MKSPRHPTPFTPEHDLEECVAHQLESGTKFLMDLFEPKLCKLAEHFIEGHQLDEKTAKQQALLTVGQVFVKLLTVHTMVMIEESVSSPQFDEFKTNINSIVAEAERACKESQLQINQPQTGGIH